MNNKTQMVNIYQVNNKWFQGEKIQDKEKSKNQEV